jgi:CDGSH-type Zn-finger protein
MSTAHRASKTPFSIDVEPGKDYWWCACGLSQSQPFCDGSHKAGGVFTPVKFTAEAAATTYFCGCKASAHAPLCDGTHELLA